MSDNSPAKRALLGPEEIETLLHGVRRRASPPDIEAALRDEFSLTIELGRTSVERDEVPTLGQGSTLRLDKLVDDPVDILVNEKLIGRGEVVVVNDKLCVRVLEVLRGKLAKAG